MHSSSTYFLLNTHWPYFRQIIEVFASLSTEQKTEMWEEVIAGLPDERQRQKFSKMAVGRQNAIVAERELSGPRFPPATLFWHWMA
jgi:hypothetical protein